MLNPEFAINMLLPKSIPWLFNLLCVTLCASSISSHPNLTSDHSAEQLHCISCQTCCSDAWLLVDESDNQYKGVWDFVCPVAGSSQLPVILHSMPTTIWGFNTAIRSFGWSSSFALLEQMRSSRLRPDAARQKGMAQGPGWFSKTVWQLSETPRSCLVRTMGCR